MLPASYDVSALLEEATLIHSHSLRFFFISLSKTHPATYLNKMLFGSQEGKLQLWNLKTKKLIFTFKGWGSPVTCVEQSPAVDVVAVGLVSPFHFFPFSRDSLG